MSPDDGKKSTWLRTTCLGCLGCFGLVILICAILVGVALMGAPSIPEDPQVVQREFPEPVAVTPEALAADLPPGAPTVSRAAGVVALDLAQAEFRIEPGPPGEPMRVEAKYDADAYTLEEVFEPAAGDQPWNYRVKFRRSQGGGFLAWLGETLTGRSPRLRILIPPDVPIALDLKASRGEVRADLGGLWLTQAAFDLSMGGMDLDVSAPLRAPLSQMTIKGGMGGGNFVRIGNASPERLDVEFRMGGMNLDLTGAWRRDAEISIAHEMGGGAVRLPRDVSIEGVPSHRGKLSSDPNAPVPVLRFRVSSEMGNVEFYD